MIDLVRHRARVLQVGVFVVCMLLAWQHRFLQDDAFISFRYARNLALGNGLVWNVGERVEGYTNFLWTLLMAIPVALGLDQPRTAMIAGMLCFAGTLLVALRLARGLGASPGWALLVMVLLGSNYTFSSYATSGLETQLQTLLVSASVLMLVRIARGEFSGLGVVAATSMLLAAACLTRLDSVLLLAPMGLFATSRVVSRRGARALPTVATLLLPGALIGAAWFAWKQEYYGSILPNTFTAKLPDASMLHGIRFVGAFFLSYWLWPLGIVAMLGIRPLWRARAAEPMVLLVTALLWLAYIVTAGGDFMEFRLFVALMPLLFVLVARLIPTVVHQRPLQALLVAQVIICGAIVHPRTFHSWYFHRHLRVASIAQLHDFFEPQTNWVGIGKMLRREFGEMPDLVIATTAAGVIPYYSELTSVDMLGLTDPWVARFGIPVSDNPGHYRIARVGYLMGRRVNLVIGPPWTITHDRVMQDVFTRRDIRRFGLILPEQDVLPAASRVVRIPLDAHFDVLIVALLPPPGWAELVQRKGWTTYPIDSR